MILNAGCGILSTFTSVLLFLKQIITFVLKLVLNDMTSNKGKKKSENREWIQIPDKHVLSLSERSKYIKSGLDSTF